MSPSYSTTSKDLQHLDSNSTSNGIVSPTTMTSVWSREYLLATSVQKAYLIKEKAHHALQ